MLRRAQLVLAAATAQYFVPAPGAPGAAGALRGPGAVFSPAEPLRMQDAALLKRHIVAPDEQRAAARMPGAWQSGAAAAGVLFVGAAVAALRGGRPAMAMQDDGAVELIEAGERVERVAPIVMQEAGSDPILTPGPIGVAPAPGPLDGYLGVSEEFGNRVWDPLGFGGFVGDNTMRWLRHAELKHGRVCMLAFVGWLVQESGGHFLGYFDMDHAVSFASVSKLGFYESWYAVPEQGRLQIITLIGWIEWVTEACGPNGHYTKGGKPGDLTFIKGPAGVPLTLGVPPEKQERYEKLELKHGRLAMIGMASIFSAMALPGSVPLLGGF